MVPFEIVYYTEYACQIFICLYPQRLKSYNEHFSCNMTTARPTDNDTDNHTGQNQYAPIIRTWNIK